MAAGGICTALLNLANVSAMVPYPLISTPSWYETPPEPPRHETEVSFEKRFEHMLLMLSLQTQEQTHDRVVSIGLRTMEPAAEAILDSICTKANVKRKDLDQDYLRVFNEARVQRKEVDPAAIQERGTEYQQSTAGR